MMKQIYEIIKLDNEQYDYLVIATSSINPLSNLSEVVSQIGTKLSNVLFDLTLINGNNSNRYISGRVKDGEYRVSDFMIVNKIDDSIKRISFNYFRSHTEAIEDSILPNSLKYLLKNGMV